MKKITFTFCFALVSQIINAQFSTTGSITHTNNQVGVGTSNPIAKTEIQTSSSSDINLLLSRNYTNTNFPCGVNAVSNPYLWIKSNTTFQGSTIFSDLFSINEIGFIGVGLKNAKYPLHIQTGTSFNDITAFFGSLPPANNVTGSRNIFMINKLNVSTGQIQRQYDQGIFWNDGQTAITTSGFDCEYNAISTTDYYNANSGFVIAPKYLPLNSTDFRGLRIDNLGNVAIGFYETFSTNGIPNRLAINGTLACKEINMDINYAWPDYVFKPTYKLMTLDSLNRFIKINSHLPAFPSAKEIENNGLQVGNIQKATIETIEGLTLYIIELNKRLEALEKQNKILIDALIKK